MLSKEEAKRLSLLKWESILSYIKSGKARYMADCLPILEKEHPELISLLYGCGFCQLQKEKKLDKYVPEKFCETCLVFKKSGVNCFQKESAYHKHVCCPTVETAEEIIKLIKSIK